jgi:hypothetical protein
MNFSKISKILILFFVLLFAIGGLFYGIREFSGEKIYEVTFDELFTRLDYFNGRVILISGFFFQGWELTVLCENLTYSEFAEDHLIPEGRMIWIEGEIPQNIYDTLHTQIMMGPEERFGKLLIKGSFTHGGQYGHLGSFKSQIVLSEVELLKWSP